MRYFFSLLAVVLLPQVTVAQDSKRAPLADYVALCLAMWDGAPDLSTKAIALELQDAMGGTSGVSMTIEKSTLRFFKSGRGMVVATSTTLADGKLSSCDINLQPGASERAELETLAQVLDLDGQILTLGPAITGRWKIRSRQPAVLIRATLGKNTAAVVLERYEPALAIGTKAVDTRQSR